MSPTLIICILWVCLSKAHAQVVSPGRYRQIPCYPKSMCGIPSFLIQHRYQDVYECYSACRPGEQCSVSGCPAAGCPPGLPVCCRSGCGTQCTDPVPIGMTGPCNPSSCPPPQRCVWTRLCRVDFNHPGCTTVCMSDNLCQFKVCNATETCIVGKRPGCRDDSCTLEAFCIRNASLICAAAAYAGQCQQSSVDVCTRPEPCSPGYYCNAGILDEVSLCCPDPCNVTLCPAGQICVAEPIFCVTTPCPPRPVCVPDIGPVCPLNAPSPGPCPSIGICPPGHYCNNNNCCPTDRPRCLATGEPISFPCSRDEDCRSVNHFCEFIPTSSQPASGFCCPRPTEICPGSDRLTSSRCYSNADCLQGYVCRLISASAGSHCCLGDLDVCPTGQPLPGIFCGRGPTRQDCPSNHYCNIDPADRFAVCCPGDLDVCPTGQPLPGIFCGRGPTRQDCPSDHYCNIDPADRFAVCCPGPCQQKECRYDQKCVEKCSSAGCFSTDAVCIDVCPNGGRSVDKACLSHSECGGDYYCNYQPTYGYSCCCEILSSGLRLHLASTLHLVLGTVTLVLLL